MSETDGRPSKRVRTDEANPGPSLDNLTQDEEFWLEDGNVVLATGKRAFKIYRGLLSIQSPVFADMFATANPDVGQLYDGCPVIRLSDSPEDLRHLLRALIPKEGTSLEATSADDEPHYSFDQLSSLTRLGHKYQIGFIERQAIACIKFFFTDNFYKWGPVDAPFAARYAHGIEVVHLARLTDNLDMLPAAFYFCSLLRGAIVRGWTREDGTVETLNADDLERCINGYGILCEETRSILSRIFQPCQDLSCISPIPCHLCISRFYELALEDPLRHTHLDVWHTAFDEWMEVYDVQLCLTCLDTLKKRENDERLAIWRRLPTIYDLPTPDGWGT